MTWEWLPPKAWWTWHNRPPVERAAISASICVLCTSSHTFTVILCVCVCLQWDTYYFYNKNIPLLWQVLYRWWNYRKGGDKLYNSNIPVSTASLCTSVWHDLNHQTWPYPSRMNNHHSHSSDRPHTSCIVFVFSVVLHHLDLHHLYPLHDVYPAYCQVAEVNYGYLSS